ncbi:glycosyltransferase family 2 protein [Tamlana agarivorans]|uniref:Glycosyltransferase family 2 protein n=1 Tax=Pseudotamlana agarivorans TaxID=481183 RepID=A0ACC5UCW4_9FLAO|nr:glycosyltransferase [Tamlana agarivorans]MBU2952139.1 glycosyltransferase family 2 protein [Tamlana agarivorans]
MILVTHNNQQVIRVFSEAKQAVLDFSPKQSVIDVLYALARQNPESLLVWQHESLAGQLDLDYIADVPVIHKKMLSFSFNAFLPPQIGYVEQSPFIAVNKKVCYPTWQMSGQVGCIKASNLLQFQHLVNDANFSYALCSIAKLAMPQGLWCYSDPKLVKRDLVVSEEASSIITLFKFVKQHYKNVWVGLLFLNLLIYEKRWALFSALGTLGVKRRLSVFKVLDISEEPKVKEEVSNIDVIIPTIGRKKYLYDVLKDLAKQTLLPKKVIVVEQNPDSGSTSDLNYLTTEIWPFKIDHVFKHRTGACFSRNLALEKVDSEWVFFADDDIRFKSDFLKTVIRNLRLNGAQAAMQSCLLSGQEKTYNIIHQTSIFGSGCSIVNSQCAKKVLFDLNLEHGFGEDTMYGNQLRALGVDIIYFPEPSILHLKAPMGGFRTEFKQLWSDEVVQPKPSPTIMYLKLKHDTVQQLRGYKLMLFFKTYKFNVFKIRRFNSQWEQSHKWAQFLLNRAVK